MESPDLEGFRLHLRVALIEQLALTHALSEPVLNGQLSLRDSRSLLEHWLQVNAVSIGEQLGAHFREPGQTALYSEEAEDVVRDMKAIVAKIADAFPKGAQ